MNKKTLYYFSRLVSDGSNSGLFWTTLDKLNLSAWVLAYNAFLALADN